MRKNINQLSAADAAVPMPFAGLGFQAQEVSAAAQVMTLIPHCHGGSSGVPASAPEAVRRPGGYELLVTLGREIRGR